MIKYLEKNGKTSWGFNRLYIDGKTYYVKETAGCSSLPFQILISPFRWTWSQSTSGARISWCAVSTWRMCNHRRHGLWRNFISWAGQQRASLPPLGLFLTSAGRKILSSYWELEGTWFVRVRWGFGRVSEDTPGPVTDFLLRNTSWERS